MNEIYLDNNATTPLLPAVWEAMRPFLTDTYGNPASAHWAGRRARQALEDARERTGALLGADPDEVIFTSGATEANNLALFGLAGEAGGHLVTSPIEHPSVAEPIERLARRGFVVDRLPVDLSGIVRAEALTELLKNETRLVSVMLANNETGAVQPVAQLVARLTPGIAFHCDAAQAAGKLPIHFHELGLTTLALTAHKFHGPKGVGVLLIRRHAKLAPQFLGGHQQQGRRPGTEAVALAVGLARALELAQQEEPARRPGCRADSLLMNLDLAGVACSTGSACSSGSLLPSPVLQAMGVPEHVLHSAMRFSLSSLLTDAEVQEAAQRVAAVVDRVRRCQ